MTALELLKEIEAWLCFNTRPSMEQIQEFREDLKGHIERLENQPLPEITFDQMDQAATEYSKMYGDSHQDTASYSFIKGAQWYRKQLQK
jgi:hypothetical protein